MKTKSKSGLSEKELYLEKIVDKIKSEPSTLKCIRELERLILMHKYFTITDVCRMLDVSKRTLQAWRDEKLISYYQIKGMIYFEMKDIEEFINRHRVNNNGKLRYNTKNNEL